MPKQVIRTPVCTINGVDLSNRFTSVEITSEKDVLESTTFGAVNKTNELGLGDGSMNFEAIQDYAAASVDATLWPIHSGATAVTITVKANNAAVSTSNPLWTMTGVLPTYSPLSGGVGELATTSVEFINQGDSGIVRTTV